jgi:Flp pilus assembly protein TadB
MITLYSRKLLLFSGTTLAQRRRRLEVDMATIGFAFVFGAILIPLSKRRFPLQSTSWLRLPNPVSMQINANLSPFHSVATCLLFFFLSWFLTRNSTASALVGGCGYFLTHLAFRTVSKSRIRSASIQQVPDLCLKLAGVMETGQSLTNAMRVLAHTYPDPWGLRLKQITQCIQSGTPTHKALESLPEDGDHPDVRQFLTMCKLSNKQGQGICRWLRELADTLTIKQDISANASAATLQLKLQSVIAASIPWISFAVSRYWLPQNTKSSTISLILIALALDIGGLFWMFSICRRF